MENLLSMLRAYRPHRLICLFGGGGNRARMRRYDMGEISAKYADLTVLTMDNPRDEEVEAINEDIKVGLARHQGKYVSIPDRGDAIRWVMDNAQTEISLPSSERGTRSIRRSTGSSIPFPRSRWSGTTWREKADFFDSFDRSRKRLRFFCAQGRRLVYPQEQRRGRYGPGVGASPKTDSRRGSQCCMEMMSRSAGCRAVGDAGVGQRGVSAVFERELCSLEEVEGIDWSAPSIQGSSVLPAGYGFAVKDIRYDHATGATPWCCRCRSSIWGCDGVPGAGEPAGGHGGPSRRPPSRARRRPSRPWRRPARRQS